MELTDFSKKCEFSNNICSAKRKNSYEMEDYPQATEQICKTSNVFNPKFLCVLKKDNSGCEEILNPIYSEANPQIYQNPPSIPITIQESQEGTGKTSFTEDNNNNSGGKIKLGKLFSFILRLLFLGNL